MTGRKARAAERENTAESDQKVCAPGANSSAWLVSLADDILRRGGRMTKAIRAIGPGIAAYEGHPFRLDLE